MRLPTIYDIAQNAIYTVFRVDNNLTTHRDYQIDGATWTINGYSGAGLYRHTYSDVCQPEETLRPAKIYGPLNRREQEALVLLSQHNVTPAADIMPEYGMAVMNLWRHGLVTYCAGSLALSEDGERLLREVADQNALNEQKEEINNNGRNDQSF